MKQEIVRHDWHRLGADAIIVGGTGHYLQGPMITDFKGWRVTPHDTSRISGVVARVKVREPWINFDNAADPQAPARPDGQGEDAHGATTAESSTSPCCLRHLMMQTELREHQNGTDATIASHVLLVRPHNPLAMSPYVGQSRRRITIDGKQVEQWLAAEEGHEVSALIALGLHADVIEPVGPGRARAHQARQLLHSRQHPAARPGYVQGHI